MEGGAGITGGRHGILRCRRVAGGRAFGLNGRGWVPVFVVPIKSQILDAQREEALKRSTAGPTVGVLVIPTLPVVAPKQLS